MTTLLLLAQIGGQAVAFHATSIEAVVDLTTVVPVPFTAAHIGGLAAIRSQVVTVIDCGMAVHGVGTTPEGRALVTSIDGHRYALRVDSVEDVVSASVAPTTAGSTMTPAWARVAIGTIDLGDRFALVVDPALIVTNSTLATAA